MAQAVDKELVSTPVRRAGSLPNIVNEVNMHDRVNVASVQDRNTGRIVGSAIITESKDSHPPPPRGTCVTCLKKEPGDGRREPGG